MKNELKIRKKNASMKATFSLPFISFALSLFFIFCISSSAFADNNDTKRQESELTDNLNEALPQQKTITGKVVDEDGISLPGVSVIVKGSTIGTITDTDGMYSLNVPASARKLEFSFIGMLPKEVEIGTNTQINVTMEQGIINLEEVVAIGYGSMERNNVTGAISSIKAEEIIKAPVPNVVEALRGQVAGVKVSRTSGQPGSGVEFLIRGKNSLTSGNDPLIVIDGVPNTGGNLAEINTADIATINILKDAAAASIYGASGANGVVLITTKNGLSGKPTFSVEASYGTVDLSMKPEMYDGPGYFQLVYDAAVGRGSSKLDTAQLLDPIEAKNLREGNSIDWHDMLLEQGNTKNVSLSLSGGTDKFHYYMNGDVYMEKGIAPKSTYDRFSFRVNTDYSPYDFLTVGARVQLSKSLADETSLTLGHWGGADFGAYVSNSPLGSLYNDEGQMMPTVTGDQFQYNNLWRYNESDVHRNRSRVYVNPWLELKILDGLTYKMNTFAEERVQEYSLFYSSLYTISALDNPPSNNQMTYETGKTMTYLWDNILNYRKEFGAHSVDATFVYGIQSLDAYTLRAEGEGSSTDLLLFYDLNGVPSEKSQVSLTPNQWGKEYYVGRVGYGYDERYNVTLTIRRDGSSKFGPDNRYGYFPSAAAAWNMHNEGFMSGIGVLDVLKLRVSYGVMGNDNIRNFAYLATTNNASYVFNDNVYTGKTTDPNNPGNPYLKWETSKQLNTGLDFGFFKNRLNGTIDYFNTQTSDLLLTEKLASHTGAVEVISNVGQTKSWGIEASVNGRILDGDFKWDMAINWAKDVNEIVSISRFGTDAEGNVINDPANGWFVGQDIDVIYDYKYIGVYQLGEEELAEQMHGSRWGAGKPKIADLSGPVTDENPEGGPDGEISSDDRTFLGSPTPEWYGGIRNTFSWKGFELTILIEAVQGVTKMNGYYGNLTGRNNQIVVDYWTPENPTNVWPQPNSSDAFGSFFDAARIRDASFVSLRNISFGYSLPANILKRTPFKGLSFYIRGNNLMYFTDYTDSYSPEIDPWEYPITKTWNISTRITF
ncbi:MAG: TonB-dependent receptor [Prolixibacteraceae bacterium]|nr:TonB-dependent receptor [Prolixibacteraceae bacterium]